MNNLHLVIDGRHIDGKANGLSRVSEELTLAISDYKDLKLTIVSNRSITPRKKIPDHVKLLVDKSFWSMLPGSLWLSARLPAIAKNLGATHVLGTLHMLPYFKPRGITYGLLMHDLVYLQYPETMTLSNRWLSSFFVPRSLRLADYIFTVSRSTLEDILQYYPRLKAERHVAYPGTTFPVPEMKPNPAKGPLRFLFVGSREPRKNLSPLLLAFEMALLRGFDGELHIVSGATWGSDKVANIIDRHLGQGIILHEKISDNKLTELYNTTDYLVMPSLYEGLGLPILEAVGRCAVLANDIPIFRELGEHIEGITYMSFKEDVNSLERLTDKIMCLTRGAPAQFRSEATKQIFTWQTFARSILVPFFN